MRLSVAMLVTLLVASAARGESPRSSQTKDLLGTRAKEWAAGPEWANSKPLELRDLRGRVVVVRFWTDTCDYCAASLPAMQKLADEFRDAPVTFVGLYHSKPYGSEKPWEVAVAKAKELGVRFPIAYDHSWKTVSNWWLKGGSRAATSSTFIIGPDGKIAFVHPGPVFFPGSDPSHARANADYEAIRAAIRTSLRRLTTLPVNKLLRGPCCPALDDVLFGSRLRARGHFRQEQVEREFIDGDASIQRGRVARGAT